MPKPPSQPAPSSAIESELFAAASPLRSLPDRVPLFPVVNSEKRFVRREFTIPPELDEYLGYHLVPMFRRFTNRPVNRSTVIRSMIATVKSVDSVLQNQLTNMAVNSDVSLEEQLQSIFESVFVLPRS